MSQPEIKSTLPTIGQQASHIFAPLQREIDRVFSDFGRGFGMAENFTVPSLDFSETAKDIELKLDVPGYTEDELTVTVEDDRLIVHGHKTDQTESGDKTYRVLERRSGEFTRQVTLPRTVDAEGFTANLKDGVLTIVAPKTNGHAGRTIPIQAASPAA
jgi:HSP20 family protein